MLVGRGSTKIGRGGGGEGEGEGEGGGGGGGGGGGRGGGGRGMSERTGGRKDINSGPSFTRMISRILI